MLLITTLIALISCQVPVAEGVTAKTREWGVQSGAFQLSIASDKDEYLTGETVRVTAVLKNVTGEWAIARMMSPVMFYDMDVRVPFPAWIGFRPRAVLTVFGETMKHPRQGGMAGGRLYAGRERGYEFDLSKLYDMSATGDYAVTFSCEPLKSRQDPLVVVTSNEIKIAIHKK